MTDDSQQASGAVDTVLFDVDGTLIDSTYHHAIAWARAFARFDLYPPLWRVHRSIGMGGDQLVPNLVGDDVESKHGGDLRDAWEEEYEKLLPEVRGFDGAADAVRAARSKGYKVALASSGKEEFTDAALEKVGLTRDDFDAVTSSAWEDNAASRRVSEKVGYLETGRGQAERRGVPTGEVYFELRPGGFVRGDEPVRITGADELRRFLGLG